MTMPRRIWVAGIAITECVRSFSYDRLPSLSVFSEQAGSLFSEMIRAADSCDPRLFANRVV
jgi:hypothetical protein